MLDQAHVTKSSITSFHLFCWYHSSLCIHLSVIHSSHCLWLYSWRFLWFDEKKSEFLVPVELNLLHLNCVWLIELCLSRYFFQSWLWSSVYNQWKVCFLECISMEHDGSGRLQCQFCSFPQKGVCTKCSITLKCNMKTCAGGKSPLRSLCILNAFPAVMLLAWLRRGS